MVYVIYSRCYEAKPSNSKGITYSTASEGTVIGRPQRSCGVCDITEVLRGGEAEELQGYHIQHSFRGSVIDRPQGSCGVCDILEVLRGFAS